MKRLLLVLALVLVAGVFAEQTQVRSRNMIRDQVTEVYDCTRCESYTLTRVCRAWCATNRGLNYVADKAQAAGNAVVDAGRDAKRAVVNTYDAVVEGLWHDQPPMKTEAQLKGELSRCQISTPCTTTSSCETMIRCVRDVFTAAHDNRAVFPTAYNVVTQQIKNDINRGVYSDREWLSRLLMAFANMYRVSLNAYMNDPDNSTMDLPTCWRQAFDSARKKRNPFVADLMLAMNAHIDHDLAISVVRTGFAESHREDYFKVERALSRSTDGILRDLGKFDSLDNHSSVGGLQAVLAAIPRFSQWITDKLMHQARSNVWDNAKKLFEAGNRCGMIGGPTCPALQHIKLVSGTISSAGTQLVRILPNFLLDGVRYLERGDFIDALARIK